MRIKFLSLLLIASNLFGLEEYWQPTEYIWNLGIMLSCDKKVAIPDDEFDIDAYKDISPGDTVWVKGEFIARFVNEVFPFIKNPFILVTGDSDHSIPFHYHKDPYFILKNKKLIHWFTQNYDYLGNNNKISPFPIGIDFHTMTKHSSQNSPQNIITPEKQESFLKRIIAQSKPTNERIVKAYADFQLNNSSQWSFTDFKKRFGETRADIYNMFIDSSLVDFLPCRVHRDVLWRIKSQYAFSISPHGVGLDCHRTWEDLILGCIVIVKKSPLDPLYEGLPVVIVDDWSEITKENMLLWLEKFGNTLDNPNYRKKLKLKYWANKINAKK